MIRLAFERGTAGQGRNRSGGRSPDIHVGIGTGPSMASGFTLIEMLISIAIFSVVMGGIFTLTGFGEKTFRRTRDETKKLKEISEFLTEFSDAVKHGRGVQYISGREIGIWKEDRDKDGRPYTGEVVAFGWDGRTQGTVYRRVGYDEVPALNRVESFEIAFDDPPPKTRHVLLRMVIDGTVYQTSLVVRAVSMGDKRQRQ